MNRSTRPKSAKGKTRPTPPPHPRPNGLSGPGSSGSSQGTSTSTNRLRQSSGRPAAAQPRGTQPSKPTDTSREEAEPTTPVPDPSQFPEISRPVSSLSRYNILPRIPSTPGHGDVRVSSPSGSEFELDLMSSFAQQMILESTKFNHAVSNSSPAKDTAPPASVPPKRGATNTVTGRQNDSNNHGSPVHKKSRTNGTRSVFASRNSRLNHGRTLANSAPHKEPKEGEPRLRLAIKLPDGKRVERYFAPVSSINDIMHFAQSKMRVPIRQCNIYSMLQVPKVLIKNWKQTLEQLEMRDRTILYIEEKD